MNKENKENRTRLAPSFFTVMKNIENTDNTKSRGTKQEPNRLLVFFENCSSSLNLMFSMFSMVF